MFAFMLGYCYLKILNCLLPGGHALSFASDPGLVSIFGCRLTQRSNSLEGYQWPVIKGKPQEIAVENARNSWVLQSPGKNLPQGKGDQTMLLSSLPPGAEFKLRLLLPYTHFQFKLLPVWEPLACQAQVIIPGLVIRAERGQKYGLPSFMLKMNLAHFLDPHSGTFPKQRTKQTQ